VTVRKRGGFFCGVVKSLADGEKKMSSIRWGTEEKKSRSGEGKCLAQTQKRVLKIGLTKRGAPSTLMTRGGGGGGRTPNL